MPKERQRISKTDQGLALPLVLFIAALLVVAGSALFATVLSGRIARSSESNKQLAELAAQNGMNRLIAKLNDTRTSDISYLWRLEQNEQLDPVGTPQKDWTLPEQSIRPLLDQPCSPLNLNSTNLQILLGTAASPDINLRNDGRGSNVATTYRLRSFSYSPGEDKAMFEVEGYAFQGSGSTKSILSRSLLTRTLALRRMITPNGWGVIAGRTMLLGNTKIVGEGNLLWLMNQSQASQYFNQTNACNPTKLGNSIGSTSSSLQSKIWPLVGIDFPSTGIFDQNSDIDTIKGTKPAQRRIWNIDDTRNIRCNGSSVSAGAGEAICTRSETSQSWSSGETAGTVTRSNGKITKITIHSEEICQDGSIDKACTIWLERINLSSGATLAIETASSLGSRPVVLRMLRPQENIKVESGTICQANYANSAGSTLSCSNSANAENLAIVASNGDSTSRASNGESPSSICSNATQILKVGSNGKLPTAIILMPTGSVSITSSASMNGILWASNICTPSGITISSTNTNGTSVVDSLKNTWKFNDGITFGRTLTKGIRGTSLDKFLKW